MWQSENSLIDHYQAAAFVAIPAKVRFDNGELRVGIRPKPKVKGREGFARNPNNFLTVPLMTGQREHSHVRTFYLRSVFLKLRATEQREIAHARRVQFKLLP